MYPKSTILIFLETNKLQGHSAAYQMLRVWDIQLGMIVVVAGIKITDVLPNFMMEPSIIMFFELETSDFAC